MKDSQQFKYKAFISYSHAADGKLAPALQSGLHRFARPWYRMRAIRIFRDETNLAANPKLWSSIKAALGESEYFILLASPTAAQSPWVAGEIAFWLQHRSPDTLLLVITDGEVQWDDCKRDFDWNKTMAVPRGLEGIFKEVPRYLDLRWARTSEQLSLKNPRFLNDIADLASTLHGRSKDEMIGEDVRQHRRTKTISAMAVASLISLTGFALYQRSQAEAQRIIAVGRQLAAQSELLRVQQGRLIELSALLAVEAMRRLTSFETDQALRGALSLLPGASRVFLHPDKLLAVALTPDGKIVVTAGYDDFVRAWDVENQQEAWSFSSGSSPLCLATSPTGEVIVAGFHDKSARVLNRETGEEMIRLDHGGQVNLVLFSPDGKYLLTSSNEPTAHLWSMPDGRLVAPMPHAGNVLSVAFASDGSLAITGSLDGTARLWTIPDARELRHVNTQAPVVNVAITQDRRHVVTASREPRLIVWDIESGRESMRLPMHAPAELLRFGPDGTVLAAAGDNLIQLWDTTDWQQTDRLSHEDKVTALLFNPIGSYLVTASLDRTARVWDFRTGREIMRVAHDEAVQDASYSADGQYLATASLDGVAHIVEGKTNLPGFQTISLLSSPSSLNYSPDGSSVAIGHDDGTVLLWDLKQLRARWKIKLGNVVMDVAFSPDNRRLAIVPRNGPVKIVRVTNGEEIGAIPQELPYTAAFSHQGQYLAVGGGDRNVRLWATDNWKEAGRLEHQDIIHDVAFSLDDRYLLSGIGSFSASPVNGGVLWDVATRMQVGAVTHKSPVESVALSRDGHYFATGSQDFTAAVWKTRDRQAVTLVRHELPVWAVGLSPDGKYLLTSSEDRTARMWVMETGQEVARLVLNGPVKDAVLSPDGTQLVTATTDGNVRFHLWRSEDMIAAACRLLTRNLTAEEWLRYLPNEPYRKTCPSLP